MIVLTLVIVGASCGSSFTSTKTASFQDFNITDAQLESEKFLQRIDEAEVKAQEWQSDAYLFTINIYFENEIISSEIKPILYYTSLDEGGNNDFYVELSKDLNELVAWGEEPRLSEDVGSEFLEIFTDEIVYGYAQALEIAEQNGGSEFRSEHDDTQTILDLYKNYQVGLEWGVYYAEMSTLDEYDVLRVFIDPVEGQIIEIVNN